MLCIPRELQIVEISGRTYLDIDLPETFVDREPGLEIQLHPHEIFLAFAVSVLHLSIPSVGTQKVCEDPTGKLV